jgi:hypothetical protein
MSLPREFSRRWRALIASLAVTALAVACGGGGGGTGIAGGGIGGTGITNGTITGFGSVIVNGQKFEVVAGRTQVVVDDNASANETQLQVGMIVTVESKTENSQQIAERITYRSDAKGAASVNAAASTITVVGQTVIVDDQTCVQTSTNQTECVTGAEGLALLAASGDSIEVSGRRDSEGRLRATRVRKTGSGGSGSGEMEIRGRVSNLNVDARTFVVNGVTVNYASAARIDGNITTNASVRVKSLQPMQGGVLIASEVKVESTPGGGATQPTIEIENFITDFQSITKFFVGTQSDPQEVTTTGATRFEPAGVTLAKDLIVRVRGKLNSSNVLVAEVVSLRPTIEIEALVSAVGENSITLLGSVVVKTNALTTFKDVQAGQIAVGNALKISAQQSGADVVATRVELEDEIDESVLRAPVSAKNADAQTLTLLGITVQTGTQAPLETEFKSEIDEDVNDQASFFNAVTAGQTVVKVKGAFSAPSTINADEAEIELPD